MTQRVESRGRQLSLAAQRMFRKSLWVGAAIALSCSDVTETTSGDEIASVGVTPSTSTLTIGAQVPLQVVVTDASGRTITDASIFWSVKDPNIASVSASGVVTGLAIGSTQVAASVAGKSAIATITVQRAPVASVVVRPSTAEVAAGGRVQFTATAYDAGQNALTDRTITWSSSNEAVATVSTTGMTTTVNAGVVTITATAEGKSDAATLTITRASVATVELTPDPLAMSVGQTTQLTATPRDANGTALTGRAATWVSSNTNVATVSDQGVVKAVATGTATITATVEGKTGTATLTVSEFAVASVTVAPSLTNLNPRASVQLTATVRDVTGAVATNRVVSWTSSNSAIASVSTTGLVTAATVGTATITATSEGQSGTATINVVPAAVATVEVNPTAPMVNVSQAVTLTVTLKDQDGFVLTGRSVSFTSSNPSVATVSPSGIITGVARGTATIVATSEGKSANVTATVTDVSAVTIQPPSATVIVGQTTTLAAIVKDVNGNVLTGRQVSWTTNNGAAATVSPTGVVTGVAPGTATITASVEGKSGTATITVTLPPVATVEVQPPAVTVGVGQSVTLSAVTKDASGNVLTGRSITWTTSNGSIATVTSSGVVSAVAPGTATITATSEGKSGTATITVAVPVATVTVQPNSVSIVQGSTSTLAAVTKDASGNTLTGRSITWTTSNGAVATVATTGVVTAVAPGTATITATSEGKSGTATVTVTPPPVATVTVSPSPATVIVQNAVTLTATTKDANGNTLTGRAITWTTSNASIATVSASGVVTGVAPGTATITATSEGKSGTASVTVIPPPVATVTVSPATASVFVPETTTLTATTKDANGNTLTGRSVAWSTSNALVATVTQGGVVTGVAPGTATITATSEGKSGSATVTVSLVPAATVTISPSNATIASGSTTTFSAVVRDASGTVVNGYTVTWTSSNSSVASVSNSGVVTGALVGTATITASAGGKSGTAPVTVTAGPIATVRVTPSSASVRIGLTAQFTAQAFDAAGNVVSGGSFNWSSSDTGIATVNSSGVVTGKKVGTVTITATRSGKSGTATVTVTQ